MDSPIHEFYWKSTTNKTFHNFGGAFLLFSAETGLLSTGPVFVFGCIIYTTRFLKGEDVNYCKSCNTAIAPQDPTRTNVGKFHYHGACFIRMVRKNAQKKLGHPVAENFGEELVVMQRLPNKLIIDERRVN